MVSEPLVKQVLGQVRSKAYKTISTYILATFAKSMAGIGAFVRRGPRNNRLPQIQFAFADVREVASDGLCKRSFEEASTCCVPCLN